MIYKSGKDEDWPSHTDESCLTVNICLGKNFKGSNLRLFGSDTKNYHGKYHDYEHEEGRMIIHEGKNRHAVTQLISGERISLIILLNKPKM